MHTSRTTSPDAVAVRASRGTRGKEARSDPSAYKGRVCTRSVRCGQKGLHRGCEVGTEVRVVKVMKV